MRFLFLTFTIIISSCTSKKNNQITIANNQETVEESTNIDEKFTIAFGSCNKENEAQPLWEDIIAEQPDLWIWLGDNIYADTENEAVFDEKYALQNSNEDYKKLKTKTPIIGTWDDHDYGKNDGDKTFSAAAKKISKKKALEFLEVPKDKPVWLRDGIYQSYNYNFNNLVIRIILLDTRYFKEPVVKGPKGYIPDEKADMLGAEQWKWLEEELAKEEDVLVIGNGTQILPEDHRFEKWANYPTSRTRFLSLLENEQTENIILLSGDRHIGEISKIEISNKSIYEVTSSGLTHSYEGVGNEENRHRVGELTPKLNYGLIEIAIDGKVSLVLSGEAQKRHLVVEL